MTASWIVKMREKRRRKKAAKKALKNKSGLKESKLKSDFCCNFPEKVNCATMFDPLDQPIFQTARADSISMSSSASFSPPIDLDRAASPPDDLPGLGKNISINSRQPIAAT
ncbi:unnamed protein product [Rodentolepis nana]|uniref:Ovule protein n=1 Tax=Rodentolepis nana TaxID=102285 RepID=A0A0R3TTD0_RODNA|nr:unnamed protein product [Rodentolepis nana]